MTCLKMNIHNPVNLSLNKAMIIFRHIWRLNLSREDVILKFLDFSVGDGAIVLISRGMKEYGKWERCQWIPWEIAYSLRKTTRNDYTSHSNAVLAVILPDKYGSYEYYSQRNLFEILRKNIDTGYIPVVQWDSFKYDCDTWIDEAIDAKNNTPSYKIVKTV